MSANPRLADNGAAPEPGVTNCLHCTYANSVSREPLSARQATLADNGGQASAGPRERLGIFLGKERGECDRLGKSLGKDARESAGAIAKGPKVRCIGRESESLKRRKPRQQRGSVAQFP